METLWGKVVLLTGAAGGLGRAMARAFSEAGAHLALLDRDARGLHALARELRESGGRVQTAVADLGTARGVEEGIRAVLADYHEQVDLLIGNVGVLVAGNFLAISEEQFQQGLTLNFLTHVWACRAVLPLMVKRKGGCIILVGSDQGSQPDAGLFPYAQAKAALHALTKALAREYGPEIRVNAVAPGMIRTPMLARWLEQRTDTPDDWTTAAQQEIEQRELPLARLGEAEEIADAVLFLAQNAFCTGTILDISGGNTRGL